MYTQLNLIFRDKAEIKREGILIKKINLKTAREFYKKHHYARGCSNSATSFGVFEKTGALVACVSFQTPCSEFVRSSVLGDSYKNHVAELGRLAIKRGVQISASMFVPLCIDAYKLDRESRGLTPIYALISFADGSQGHHGGVYQAMSWVYTGESKNTKHVYRDTAGRMRHSRQRGVNISPNEARERGWSVTRATGCKYRYIKMIYGSSRFKRRLLKISKYQNLPYPKPKSER